MTDFKMFSEFVLMGKGKRSAEAVKDVEQPAADDVVL
jgi:hypothetical protein